jgi:predicted kinase
MEKFDQFIAEFKSTPAWATMLATVENSPWHREANVAVHTEMVMQQYRDRFAAARTSKENLIALSALLFHDTGKPSAEEVVEKKDGSGEVYRRYAGHEQDSAVTFSELYVTMPSLRALLTPIEARAVRWIIEHHLPYGLKDVQKRRALAAGTYAALEEAGVSYETFFDCLRSDAAGRISDDHETKLQAVEDWIAEFKTVSVDRLMSRSMRTMYILVGPSGSGKTTYIKQHFDPQFDRWISMDELKLEFFDAKNFTLLGEIATSTAAKYDLAWEYANDNESAFKKFVKEKVDKIFDSMEPSYGSVFIDITNLGRKVRTQWVERGHKHGMRMVGVEFWNAEATLHARQFTRGDKIVPRSSVRQQIFAQTCCFIGQEVDEVQMIIGDAPEVQALETA